MSVNHPHQSSNRRRFTAAATLFAFAVVAGCSSEPPRVPVFPVSGKVIYKNQPAEGAQVVLFAINSANTAEVSPAATVGKDGTFKLTVYDPGDGAPEGDYVATIRWRKTVVTDGSAATGPNVIPEKYGSAATSPIKVSVKAGSTTQIPPIAIN